ncbi:MAG: DUF6732 family protein [Planktomarina sp.]
MTKYLGFLIVMVPLPAHAHFGHVGELAGHDHVVIGAALGAAVLAGLIGALKGKTDEDDEQEPQEA